MVCLQPLPKCRLFNAFLQRHDQAGLADLPGEFDGERRTTVQLAQVENQRPVGILDVAPGAGLVIVLCGFYQRVAGGNRPVFRPPTLWAPATNR